MDTPSQVQRPSSYPLARYYPQTQSGIVLALASYFIYLGCGGTREDNGIEPELPAGALGRLEINARLELGDEKFFVPEILPLVQQKIHDLTNNTAFELSQDDSSILEFIEITRAWKEVITKKLQEQPIDPATATQEEVALAMASSSINSSYGDRKKPSGVLTKEQISEIMSRHKDYYYSPPLRMYEKIIQDLTGFHDWGFSYEREDDILPTPNSMIEALYNFHDRIDENEKH